MTRLAALGALVLVLGGFSCSSETPPGGAGGAAWSLPGGSPGEPGAPPPSSGLAGESGAPAPSSSAPAPGGPSVLDTSSLSTNGIAQFPKGSPHPYDPDLDWTGWTLHPGLSAGCRGMYVPDDVKKRERPLRWKPCAPSMGISCQEMVRNWGSDVLVFPGVGTVSVGGGTEPDVIGLYYWHIKSKIQEVVLYDTVGQPIAALREDTWHDDPGAHFVPGVSLDGKFLSLKMSWSSCWPDKPEGVLVVPADDPAQLMYATQPTFTWSSSIVAHQDVQGVEVSGQIAAAMLIGAAAVGDLSTGKSVMITPPPHGDVDWWPYDIIGRTAFVLRGTNNDTSIWVSRDLGMATPLVQAPGEAVSLATDGKTMVWSVSTGLDPIKDLVADADVYEAPYSTDPARLEATKKWVGRLPSGWGGLGMNNGYVYGGEYVADVRHFYVLRLSDGKWWELVMPEGWLPPSSLFFASPTELWLVAGNVSVSGRTILRVPYSQLVPRDYAQGGPP